MVGEVITGVEEPPGLGRTAKLEDNFG